MRKLNLESVMVESFETTPYTPPMRGTAYGHQVRTWNAAQCGETNHFDCTSGCSWNTACPGVCFGQTEDTCEPA